jgi:hypothetical protein
MNDFEKRTTADFKTKSSRDKIDQILVAVIGVGAILIIVYILRLGM